MSKEDKMTLHLSQNNKGESEIWLDGKRLKNVVGYKIESTNPLAGVMLSLEVMVQLPEWRNLR